MTHHYEIDSTGKLKKRLTWDELIEREINSHDDIVFKNSIHKKLLINHIKDKILQEINYNGKDNIMIKPKSFHMTNHTTSSRKVIVSTINYSYSIMDYITMNASEPIKIHIVNLDK